MAHDSQDNKTVRQTSKSRWAVFGSRIFFWREMAGASVALFAFVIGASAIGWTFISGGHEVMSSVPVLSRIDRKMRGVVDDAHVLEEERPSFRRAIDGVRIPGEETGTDYIAVVLDNFSAARPIAGIADALLVIEAPVEAGITRLLAFYAYDNGLDRIGPIRSARPYFIDWAEEYDAFFVHVGGSDEALGMLKGSSLRDLDEMTAGAYFERDRTRFAPHNTYTSAGNLDTAVTDRYDGHISTKVVMWEYKEEPEVGEFQDKGGDISVHYGNSAYAVTWLYENDANGYLRQQGGKTYVDELGTPVRAKNIVVQYTEVRIIDAVGRRHITTEGDGRVLIFRDGEVVEGTWRKDGGRTMFFTEDDEPVLLNAGTTWIEVVPLGTDVSY